MRFSTIVVAVRRIWRQISWLWALLLLVFNSLCFKTIVWCPQKIIRFENTHFTKGKSVEVRSKTCRGIWATQVTELSNSSHKNRKPKLQCPADDAIYSLERFLTVSVTKQTPEALFHQQVITNKYAQLTYVLERLSVTLFSIFHFSCSGITTLLSTSRICTHRPSLFRAHIR